MASRLRNTSALALGSVASGVLAYVFFALVTRALGPELAAPVSVLWAYWSFAGAALSFPLQHWIARTVEAAGDEGEVRAALPGVVRLVVATTVVATAAAWLGRDLLFHSGTAWFPVLVGLVTLGSALMGVVRGVLTARHRFRAVGAGLVAENALRCVAAAALMVAGVDDPVAYGFCLVAGYATAGLWSSALRVGTGARDLSAPSATAFLGGSAGGQLIGQAVLTGGPVVLALAGGSATEITALFAGLALFRAPYTFAVGMVAAVTSAFTRLVVERRTDVLRRIRLRIVAGTLVVAALAGVLGAALGPAVLRLVFGPDVRLSSDLTAVLAVASTVAMTNLLLTVMVMAHGRTGALVLSWVVALVPGAVWFAGSGGSALERTCAAFLVVEAAACCLLLVVETRLGQRLGGRSAASNTDDPNGRS